MISQTEANKLINFIQENLRASRTTDIVYLDAWNLKERLKAKHHHVIFGRRGTGKTMLLNTLRDSLSDNCVVININLQQHKMKSLPNVILIILETLFDQTIFNIKDKIKWYDIKRKSRSRKLIKELRFYHKFFQNNINEFDEYKQSKIERSKSFNESLGKIGKKFTFDLGFKVSDSQENEISKELSFNKLSQIYNEIQYFKRLIKEIIDFYKLKAIYLCLDDYYYLRQDQQLKVVDFFHSLAMDIQLYLKIATIRNKTLIFKKIEGLEIGMEIGDDVQEINLDIHLENFHDIERFMHKLFKEILKRININYRLDELMDQDGWIQLCLASGGVPRDFLQLFKRVLEKSLHKRDQVKDLVIICAKNNLKSKNKHLEDENIGNREILEVCRGFITSKILDNIKINIFLISKKELELYPNIRKAINELLDYRMLHIVKSDLILKNVFDAHEAYMIDTGFYRFNYIPADFRQVKPRKLKNEFAFRESEIKTSPILMLSYLNDFLDEYNVITDD